MNERLKNFWIPEFIRTNFPSLLPSEKIRAGDVLLLRTELVLRNRLRPDSSKLFSKIMESAEFGVVIQGLQEVSVPAQQNTPDGLKGRLAGRIFELASFYFLKEELKPGEILLSPDETFLVYSVIYPNRQIDKVSPFFSAIEGISVPDGIILAKCDGRTRITGVVDYSVGRDVWMRKKFAARKFFEDFFRKGPERASVAAALGRSIHSMLPNFPSWVWGNRRDFLLAYVVPEDEEGSPDSDGQVIKVPLLRSEVHLFVEAIFQDVKGANVHF